MTPEAIRNEIIASDELRAFIAAGNEQSVAMHLTDTQPGKIVPLKISKLGLLALYANPVDGATVLGTIAAVAQANPIVAIVWEFMQPGVQEASLPDNLLSKMLGELIWQLLITLILRSVEPTTTLIHS